MSGPEGWAWVGGAAEGLGAAFATALAQRGHGLLLFDRQAEALQALARDLGSRYGLEVHPVPMDLGRPDLAERLEELVALHPPAIAIYNAAVAPVGDFLGQELGALVEVVDVNVRGPLVWTHVVGNAMARHGGGSIALMSSLAGLQGTPRLAAYAASKAFSVVLAEGLWAERKDVHVVCCCAGAIRTPGMVRSTGGREAPGTLDADEVARQVLDGLARGPRVVPGPLNRLAELVVGRLLPRWGAVAVMGRATRDLK